MKILSIIFLSLNIACSANSKVDFKDIKIFILQNRIAIIDDLDILINLPLDSDLTNLEPIIVVSDKASIEPESGVARNFTRPVTYVVTAQDGSTKTYTAKVLLKLVVNYFGNGNIGGEVPVDPNGYEKGAEVTILGNNSCLVKENKIFAGWCLNPNCDENIYNEGDKIILENDSISLYAKWDDFECMTNDLIDHRYECKSYKTVIINNECWMEENLNVGIKIVSGSYASDNDIIEKYCYDNLDSNCNTYGGLYSWTEAMAYETTENAKGICPSGWHIPSKTKYEALIDYLGGTEVAGGKLKVVGTEYWLHPNLASNESGFSVLGSGMLDPPNLFGGMKYAAHIWTSKIAGNDNSWRLLLSNSTVYSTIAVNLRARANSIRCLKN